jgi:glutaminyl-tRNA synthetase
VTAYVERSLADAQRDERFQFERQGYFVADREDHRPEQGKLVFNRITTLKDTFNRP